MADVYLKSLNFGTENTYYPLPIVGEFGSAWNESSITGKDFDDIIFDNNKWIACGSYGVFYSYDGKTWNETNITTWIERLFIGNNLYHAVGNGDFYYSYDGITWTLIDSYMGIGTVVYGDDIYVASGNGAYVYYSTDGINWSTNNYSPGIGLVSICYNNGLWMGCGTLGLYYTSNPKKTWTLYQDSILQYSFAHIYYANGIWQVHNENGYNCYSTDDGNTWNESSESNINIYYKNNLWIGYGRGLYYSEDGINWTSCGLSGYYFNDVKLIDTVWVACHQSKGIYISSDGKVWTNVISGNFDCAVGDSNIIIAVGNNGIYYSENSNSKVLACIDGEWLPKRILTLPSASAADAGKFLAVDDYGNWGIVEIQHPFSVATTLLSSNWDSTAKTYSFEADYPSTTYNVEIEIDGDSCTDEQLEAWIAAKPLASSINKINAKGDVPSVDIPVILIIIPK